MNQWDTEDGRLFGYVRVSTKMQHIDRQVITLEEYGVRRENLYIDKVSGKDFNRPAYKRMVRNLHRGDVLAFASLDRLGRNYDDIIEQWRVLTKEKQAHIVILDMPLLDTRTQHDELLGTFVADLVLQIMSYVAQNERDMMRQRQQEGIEAAKRKGVRFGRPPLPISPQFPEVYVAWKEGYISSYQAAKKLGVAYDTFMRWTKRAEEEKLNRSKP